MTEEKLIKYRPGLTIALKKPPTSNSPTTKISVLSLKDLALHLQYNSSFGTVEPKAGTALEEYIVMSVYEVCHDGFIDIYYKSGLKKEKHVAYILKTMLSRPPKIRYIK